MPTASSNGIELYYETNGSPDDPALLLVNGYSSQLLQWGEEFRQGLADNGRYVICFDNRDVGLSTHLDGVEVDIDAVMSATAGSGDLPEVPYTLSSFGDDAVGLLDHLGIDAAHIAGSSMGGMIVQQMAIDHPDRVLTMTSIMSTTSEPGYFESTPEAMEALTGERPTERDAYITDAVERAAVFSSSRYYDRTEAAAKTAAAYDRAFYPEGMIRQMAAVRGSADRSEGLGKLNIPTLVIHGRDDSLIMPQGGERTAELIPGANLMMLHDMGHDLPSPLWPRIIDTIISHTSHALG
ncbi:MAG: alpha/beta hydrolase [Actinomycetia bacterium]|nr:alpha/beta hydrolase [Actinomycetes bacterium]